MFGNSTRATRFIFSAVAVLIGLLLYILLYYQMPLGSVWSEITRNNPNALNEDLSLTTVTYQRPVENDTTHITHKDTEQDRRDLVKVLSKDLARKLKDAAVTPDLENRTCASLNISYKDTCNEAVNKSCPQRHLPDKLEDRIEQIAMRENLQVPVQYRNVLKDMAKAVPGSYDVIIVSALSSNHYLESQAMLKNLHEVVFPKLTNFTLVVYDLGLTEKERKEYQAYCRCHLLRFPFESFPPHMLTLKCFGWKPTVIQAHYARANLVIWTDASIRIKNGSAIPVMLERARERGLQQRFFPFDDPTPYYTLIQMFYYFGDSPCAYMGIPQEETGFGIYHRELFVEKAILDPWYGCAVRSECTCPVVQRKVQACPKVKGETRIGLCMRNEQSSLSIILGKLFREKYHHFVVHMGWFQDVRRDAGHKYFDELKRKSKLP